MADIVELLRDAPGEVDCRLRLEAADEIERLRAVIDLAAKSLSAARLWQKYEDQK